MEGSPLPNEAPARKIKLVIKPKEASAARPMIKPENLSAAASDNAGGMRGNSAGSNKGLKVKFKVKKEEPDWSKKEDSGAWASEGGWGGDDSMASSGGVHGAAEDDYEDSQGVGGGSNASRPKRKRASKSQKDGEYLYGDGEGVFGAEGGFDDPDYLEERDDDYDMLGKPRKTRTLKKGGGGGVTAAQVRGQCLSAVLFSMRGRSM